MNELLKRIKEDAALLHDLAVAGGNKDVIIACQNIKEAVYDTEKAISKHQPKRG